LLLLWMCRMWFAEWSEREKHEKKLLMGKASSVWQLLSRP
jgi:hypothetical protein